MKEKESCTDLILIDNECKPKKKESRFKLKCKKFYSKAKELFVKSKPIIHLTDIYLTSSAVIKLFMDIFMIYTFGNAGVIYYIY